MSGRKIFFVRVREQKKPGVVVANLNRISEFTELQNWVENMYTSFFP